MVALLAIATPSLVVFGEANHADLDLVGVARELAGLD